MWIGSVSGCTTRPSGPGGASASRFSAIVLPVTVRQSPCSSPASSRWLHHDRHAADRVEIDHVEPTARLEVGDVRDTEPTALKSSSVSSTFASFAIARRCSTAFVDPPSALVTAIAFSNASLVMI